MLSYFISMEDQNASSIIILKLYKNKNTADVINWKHTNQVYTSLLIKINIDM